MKVCRLMCNNKLSVSRDEMRMKKKVMRVMIISLSFCMIQVKLESLKNCFWHLDYCADGSCSPKLIRSRINHKKLVTSTS